MKRMLDLLYAGDSLGAYFACPGRYWFYYVGDEWIKTGYQLTTMLLLIAVAEGETL